MLLDILFPKTCLGCSRVGRYICKNCINSYEYIYKDACIVCKRIHSHGLIHENCKELNGIDGTLSLLYYNSIMKKIIKNIKYKLVKSATYDVFHSFAPEVVSKMYLFKKQHPHCFLQPIPLHPKRQRERGFNQAHLIADWLKEITDYPLVDFIKRIKYTNPQARTHNKIERIYNIKNAFALKNKKDLSGMAIVLVDDVFTTGNTSKECAKVLKKAGAESVFVFSIAQG